MTSFELVKRRVLDAATGCCDWMLRLGDQLWIEEPVEGATRRRLDKLKCCVSRIASGTSREESASFWFSLRLDYSAPCNCSRETPDFSSQLQQLETQTSPFPRRKLEFLDAPQICCTEKLHLGNSEKLLTRTRQI
ncbi:hypothetical protein F511_41363 [Dorcoceras hygrometricum]|uniref:Uncharacterized protein n=1 Tax=Dorcoceras hygrometricum TaxID=472368 RepID=A0A2Z7AY55_9LAMI|nr:hypothetical protein F511_41363 [Dorcoceras hygrometricum]